jgi:hypothetical protein
MFAQSDPDLISAVLGAAGFTDVQTDAHQITFLLGETIDDAVWYLADSGPGRVMLESIPEGSPRDAALDDVREALRDHSDRSGVRLRGGVWIVTARKGADRK